MTESKELEKIKKIYGENFMKLCRELFPTLLEKEGLLTKILTTSFSTNSRTLYEDINNAGLIEEFKNYVYSKVDVEKDEPKIIEEKTPYELLEEAGYDLYECNSEEEIQKFKRFYKQGEELCTFRGERLNRCFVFWAIKRDAENIKREDFEIPKREDEYGTSVMGIQFTKDTNSTVSIKNRYNHTVNNPDATYGNDLDRIIPGLEQSFSKLLEERGFKLNNFNIERFEIPGYTVASDGKYYKFNMEINGIYYCPGNIIIDNQKIIKLESEKQVLIDCYIINNEKDNKTLKKNDDDIRDSFIDEFKDIEKIKIDKDKEGEKGTRVITIQKKDSNTLIEIKIDKDNNVIGYTSEELTQVGNNFLNHNERLSQLDLPELTQVGDNFLYANRGLSKLDLPELTQVGNRFLRANIRLSELYLQKLTQVGNNFLNRNERLSQLDLPNLIQVGDKFLCMNERLSKLYLPKVTQVGSNFLYTNERLSQLDLPELTQVGNDFLYVNRGLSKLDLPKVTQVGSNFLYSNERLSELDLPKVTQVGDKFLYRNKGLSKLDLPELTQVGNNFFCENKELSKLTLQKLIKVGDKFLYGNVRLSELDLPNLTQVGNNFLYANEGLSELDLPKLRQVGDRVLCSNKELSQPELDNKTDEETSLPNFEKETKDSVIAPINEYSIAELDKETKITESEVNWGKRIIEKIKSLFKLEKREEDQR